MVRDSPLFEEIVRIIGLRAAITLAEEKGGQRIKIPGKILKGHWLVKLIGLEKAKDLSAFMTNGTRINIEMPRGLTSVEARRRKEINRRLDEGQNSNQIAAAVGVSARWIMELRKRRFGPNGDPRQPRFFD